jgi:hypothetical protein
MKRRKDTNSELGMMYGIIVGAAIGTLLFVFTHNAIWLTAIGVGVALGLSIGAGKDRGDS